jgi:hypothetical protein
VVGHHGFIHERKHAPWNFACNQTQFVQTIDQIMLCWINRGTKYPMQGIFLLTITVPSNDNKDRDVHRVAGIEKPPYKTERNNRDSCACTMMEKYETSHGLVPLTLGQAASDPIRIPLGRCHRPASPMTCYGQQYESRTGAG